MSKLLDSFNGNCAIMYSHGDVIALLDHARALEQMLMKHRWVDIGQTMPSYCVHCGQYADDHPDCALAKLLE